MAKVKITLATGKVYSAKVKAGQTAEAVLTTLARKYASGVGSLVVATEVK